MEPVTLRWELPGLSTVGRQRALGMLTVAEHTRLASMPVPQQDSFLQGRMLLRTLAAELTGVAAELIVITAVCPDCGAEHGQPMVAGSRLHVALTRCAAALVAVASWNGAVGVDAEPMAGGEDRLDAIDALTGIRSLQHWTAVEAVLKADGRGLRVDPREVLLEGGTGRIRHDDERYAVTTPDLDSSFAVAVARQL